MSGQPRILVTGGAGYIGSHTCKALRMAGAVPVAYDSLVTGNADAVKWGPLVVADVRDRWTLLSTFREHGIDAVMHFAGAAIVAESVLNPSKYYDINVSGLIALLDVCRDYGIENVVFSSSCATYGNADCSPITEETPQLPVSPYGRTKLIGETMLRDYEAAFGIRHASLRYFNAAGADPDGEVGEHHEVETRLIPLALMVAAGQLDKLEIRGTDYPTQDGTCIRDYVHVSDLARAHVLALRHLTGGGASLELNLGTGRGHSVRQVLGAVEQVTGRAIPVRIGPRRPADPPELTADGSRAKDVLGFRPEHPDLKTMVRHAASWQGLMVAYAEA